MYSRYYKLMIVVLRFMYSYQHAVLFIGNYQYVCSYYWYFSVDVLCIDMD